jgi:hypothetical protein
MKWIKKIKEKKNGGHIWHKKTKTKCLRMKLKKIKKIKKKANNNLKNEDQIWYKNPIKPNNEGWNWIKKQ